MTIAVNRGHAEMALELVKAKADINRASHDGVCATSIVVDPHAFDVLSVHHMCAQNGVTPLTIAVNRGHTEMALELVKAKADINRASHDEVCATSIVVDPHAFDVLLVHHMCAQNGVTALNVAVIRGNTEMAVELVKAKAEINRQDQVRVRLIVVNLHALDLLIGASCACAEWSDTIEYRR